MAPKDAELVAHTEDSLVAAITDSVTRVLGIGEIAQPSLVARHLAPHIVSELRDKGFEIVKLPESDETDDDGQIWVGDYELRVDPSSGQQNPTTVYWRGREVSTNSIRRLAGELLSAASIADRQP